jgi:hypothetical protein
MTRPCHLAPAPSSISLTSTNEELQGQIIVFLLMILSRLQSLLYLRRALAKHKQICPIKSLHILHSEFTFHEAQSLRVLEQACGRMTIISLAEANNLMWSNLLLFALEISSIPLSNSSKKGGLHSLLFTVLNRLTLDTTHRFSVLEELLLQNTSFVTELSRAGSFTFLAPTDDAFASYNWSAQGCSNHCLLACIYNTPLTTRSYA